MIARPSRFLSYAACLFLGAGTTACTSGVFDSRPILKLRSGPILTLDPLEAADAASLREIGRTYETPLRYRRKPGPGNSRELEPWLLASLPRAEQGGARWHLDFKPGRRFHSSKIFSGSNRRRGREITACDWVESIQRHLEDESRSPWKSYLLHRLASAQSIRCEGNQRAVVNLKIPDPEFAYFLAHPAASVVPAREVKERGWRLGDSPVGSGAFRLSRPLSTSGGVLQWEAEDTGVPLRGVLVDLSDESDRDWNRLRSGDLDAVELPESLRDRLVGADGELRSEWAQAGFSLVKVARSDLVMVGISPVHPLLSRKRGLRLALGLAIPSDELARGVFGGRAIPATGPLPPGVQGYHLDYRHFYRGADIDRARDLLGSNGHVNGRGLPRFLLGCLPHSVERAICAALIRSWAAVGIKVEERILEPEQRREAILAGKIDLWPVTWVADLPGPASFLEVFAGSVPEVPALPASGEDRNRFYKLLNAIRIEPRPEAHQKAVDAALDYLNLESPAIFLLHRFQHWLVRKGAQGVGLEDFSWHDSGQVSISEAR